MEIYNYINGKKNGEYKKYNGNGKLVFMCTYLDDEKINV